MNKWYRLGSKFRGKFTELTLNEYLSKNNLYNNESGITKDFTEKDYKKICKIIDCEIEQEEKKYLPGEKKYYFYWGFDRGGKNE